MKQKIAAIIVVSCLVLVLLPSVSFAQKPPSPTPNYLMPYPGILPDNPLYGLKTLRDKVMSILIGDPLKKASFDLLQADKRIGAALILIKTGDREKQRVALSTISKGQNYYEDAIAKLEEAKKQGAGVADVVTIGKRAGQQHVYVLQKAKKSLPKSLQPTMESLINRSITLQEKIREIK